MLDFVLLSSHPGVNPIVVQAPTATHNAYSGAGGRSLYGFSSGKQGSAAAVNGNYLAYQVGHWAHRGSGLKKGDSLTDGPSATLSYETDGVEYTLDGNHEPKVSTKNMAFPDNLIILGLATLPNWNQCGAHNPSGANAAITLFSRPDVGGSVFAAGTVHWASGLGKVGADRNVAGNYAIITRNVLQHFTPTPLYAVSANWNGIAAAPKYRYQKGAPLASANGWKLSAKPVWFVYDEALDDDLAPVFTSPTANITIGLPPAKQRRHLIQPCSGARQPYYFTLRQRRAMICGQFMKSKPSPPLANGIGYPPTRH